MFETAGFWGQPFLVTLHRAASTKCRESLCPWLTLNSDLSLYQELSVPCFRPVGVLRSVMGGYYVLGPGEQVRGDCRSPFIAILN